MKRILPFLLLISLFIYNDIKEAVALNAARFASSRSVSHSDYNGTTSSIQGLIGKEIQGCKIVGAIYDTENSFIHIVCYKDDTLYRYKVTTEPFSYECDGYICWKHKMKDIVKLLKEE